MKNKLLKSILSSGLQAFAVQILGVAFFYLLSFYISKEDFGVIGWANATSMLMVTLLSFGMEQVVVRRIAASGRSDWAATAFLLHSFLGSVLFLGVIFLIKAFVPAGSLYYYLPIFFVAQSLIYVSTPLKQFLNAKERFAPYGFIAFISNLSKVVVIYYLFRTQNVNINSVGLLLVAAGVFELVSLMAYTHFNKSVQLPYTFKMSAYKMLLKESLPQYFTAIFDSSLSRIDWILLGLISTAGNIADYSFAYRAYEVAKLPLMVLGPVLMVKYSKLLGNNRFTETHENETRRLLSILVFLSMIIVIVGNLLWRPVIGTLTHEKYGDSNALLFLILSVCLPLHFLINLLWTLSFAARKYRQITKVTIIVAITNLVLNLALIPFLGGVGAAISYILATIVQGVVYHRIVNRSLIKIPMLPVLAMPLAGLFSCWLCHFIPANIVLQVLAALMFYVVLCVIFKFVRKSDVAILRSYLRK